MSPGGSELIQNRHRKLRCAEKGETEFTFLLLFVIDVGRFVGAENALQMIEFMLKNVREESGGAAREERTMLVVGANGCFLRARYRAPLAADGETPFVFRAFCA